MNYLQYGWLKKEFFINSCMIVIEIAYVNMKMVKIIEIIDLFPRTYTVGRYVSAGVRSYKKTKTLSLLARPMSS